MLKEYLAELQKTPLLSREEETELWQRYAGGDQEAYNKLMTSYQPLVFKTAAGFKLPEQQTMELVQEGMLGLLEAAERYDYKRGIAFSVFAVHRIRGRMLDFLHVEDGAKSFSLDDTNAAGIAWADVLAVSGRTPFEIHNASVAWPVPGDVLPTVNLDATTRFRRYDIFLRVTGPLEQMEMILRSDPALTKDQIIKMLTLQREVTGTNQGVTQDDFQNLMTVGLEMTVLGDVEEIFKETLGLNEFMIYSGRLRTGHSLGGEEGELTEDEKDQYNILVSKYLTDNLLVGYTVSSDSEHESIFAQYDISRHMSINYERNKDYDTTEDWYGIEYKVTF